MRPIPKAALASAVALAFATAANAAVFTNASSSRATTTALSGSNATSGAAMVSGTTRGSFQSNAPRIQGGPAATTAPSTSGGTTTPTNTGLPPLDTTVDLRDQDTRNATAGTHASGSTSALGPLANGAASVSGPTGTPGTGATGTALPPFVGTPIYANPSDSTMGSAVNAPTTNGYATTDVYGNAVYANASGVVVTEAQVNGAYVDRAINQVSRDRKRVGRNGQLLYSIAPRTNVDRTAQMADDPLPPALTGSNSTLTR